MKKMKGPIQAYDSFKSSIEDLSKEIHKGVDAVITKFKVKAKQVKQIDVQILQQHRDCLHELMFKAEQDAA